MKGLTRIPCVSDLLGAYEKIQAMREPPPSRELAKWTQWSRFDPRLAEQLVALVSKTWRHIPPAQLNEALLGLPWPAAMGVLLEQIRSFGDLNRKDKTLFCFWSCCVMSSIKPANGELFFIGLRAFGGELMRQDAFLSILPFSRWGYLGRDVLFNKARPRDVTLIGARARRVVLDGLVGSRPRLTVADYIEALGGGLSVRQAERDLRAHPRVKANGNTRARMYLKK